MTAEEQLIDDIGIYCRDPLGFARYSFPWHEEGDLAEYSGPREWQADVLDTVGRHLRSEDWATPLLMAIASGHGIGKSALVGMVINWAMSTCEDCRVVVTANTGAQLRTKTIPEVSKWFRLGINAHWWDVGAETIKVKDPKHEKSWRTDFLTWSLENSEAFAGLHNKNKRIVVICDEASAIPTVIKEVIEGALTDEDTEIIFLAFGNPTQNTGWFFEAFNRLKHRWVTRQIDARKVEGTSKTQIKKWIDDYGEDSDFVRIRVRGVFPRAGSRQFISSDTVQAAVYRQIDPAKYEHHWKVLVCDVARFGDDQTVIGYRQGPKFTILDKLRGLPVDQVARRLMMRVREHDPRTIVVDGDGIGGGVIDVMRGDDWFQGWMKQNTARRLTEFHGGIAPIDGFMYFNYIANMWGLMRAWLAVGSIPDDPELEADLTGREYGFSNKNQIQLEKKEDMKKRGLASPDTSDVLAMSFCAIVAGKTQEERDREKLEAVAKENIAERSLLQYKLTMEKEARERGAEERRPEHWE